MSEEAVNRSILPFIPDHTHLLSAVAALALARRSFPQHRQLLTRTGAFLATHQNAGGGWAFTERVTQADVESTSAVLEALHAINPTRYAAALNRDRTHLAHLGDRAVAGAVVWAGPTEAAGCGAGGEDRRQGSVNVFGMIRKVRCPLCPPGVRQLVGATLHPCG
ncbi:hypothetical protein ACWD1W_07205 [Streptomyces olivaceoviridis]